LRFRLEKGQQPGQVEVGAGRHWPARWLTKSRLNRLLPLPFAALPRPAATDVPEDLLTRAHGRPSARYRRANSRQSPFGACASISGRPISRSDRPPIRQSSRQWWRLARASVHARRRRRIITRKLTDVSSRISPLAATASAQTQPAKTRLAS